ncbi:MAG: hypothetical protein ACRDDF_12155 [Aeromonas sp.]
MIGNDHMATPIERNTENSVVGLLTKDILAEMKLRETERSRFEVRNRRQLVAFRMARCSKRLRNFICRNNLLACEWHELISEAEHKMQREKQNELNKRGVKYNKINSKYREMKDDRRFWKPRNIFCHNCESTSHDTRMCQKDRRVSEERIHKAERDKKESRDFSSKGGYEAVRCRSKSKQFKQLIDGKDDLFARYNDLFFKAGEKIEFCKVEKCRIDTKRGAKVVKKGAVIPQALRKLTDEYIRDLENRGVIRRSQS